MDLSELLGLLQYEVQKSYDFAAELAKAGASPTASVLQVALERVEVDLPVLLSQSEVTFNRASRDLQPVPTFAKAFRLPYAPERVSLLARGRVPKGEVKGKTLTVELVGPREKLDEETGEERIARLRVVLRPVMK
jgi:hypothetical protein